MIIIKENERSIPFVREMIVESLTQAGMKPWQAHSFSKEIEDELYGREITEIEGDELTDLIFKRLGNVNERVAQRYRAWRQIKSGDREPMIILIGGGTGVGTTTVGTEIAHRLGIKNVLATDSIREVMRKTLSEKLLPALHASSYNAYKKLSVQLSREKEQVITGFKLQTAQVNVGIEAIVERAIKEGTPTLIEGLHIIPSFLSDDLRKKYNVMVFILHIKDEKEHKNRLYSRAFETKFRRSIEGYMENFKNIREIQEYIKDVAEEEGTPILENQDAEKTIVELMDRVIDKIIKQTTKEESD